MVDSTLTLKPPISDSRTHIQGYLANTKKRTFSDFWSNGGEEIFISYRRRDSQAEANSLAEKLVSRYGKKSVFRDLEKMGSGEFREQIDIKIEQCKVFILVIGSRWLDIQDDEGGQKLFNLQDVHRREIEKALGLHSVTVIPILVDGANHPKSEELPDSLKPLAELHSFTIHSEQELRMASFKKLFANLSEYVPVLKWMKRTAIVLTALSAALLLAVQSYLPIEPSSDISWDQQKEIAIKKFDLISKIDMISEIENLNYDSPISERLRELQEDFSGPFNAPEIKVDLRFEDSLGQYEAAVCPNGPFRDKKINIVLEDNKKAMDVIEKTKIMLSGCPSLDVGNNPADGELHPIIISSRLGSALLNDRNSPEAKLKEPDKSIVAYARVLPSFIIVKH